MRFQKLPKWAVAAFCAMLATAFLPSCIMRKPQLQKPQSAQAAPTQKKASWLQKLNAKLFPNKSPKKPRKATQPIWMGTVSLVNLEHSYALIDSNTLYAAIPGKSIFAVSPTRETARMRISAEKNPPFFIADIISGTPEVGNRVYSPEIIDKP